MANVKHFDGVLADGELSALDAFGAGEEVVKTQYGTSIWQDNAAANPQQSKSTFVWTSQPVEALLPPGVTVELLQRIANIRVFPTGTAVDSVFDAIRARSGEIDELTGPVNQTWVAIIAHVYSYGVGEKAVWHRDEGPYSGAFVFYTHERWDKDWGGQFLYSDIPVEDGLPSGGHFVSPKPNRLLVLRGGTWHCVSEVAQAAGNHRRSSVAGFFVRPEGIAELIQTGLRAFQQRQLTR